MSRFCLFSDQADGEAATWSLLEFEGLTSLYHLLGDGVGLRVSLVVSIFGVGVDGAEVLVLIGFVYTTGSDGATILLVCCRMLHHIERGIFSTPATNGRNSTLSFRQVVIA